MTFLRSVALLLPPARPTTDAEVASAPEWRGICELPGRSPADMAIDAGAAALAAAHTPRDGVGWVLHGGSSAQGALGWPVHHHIQHGIVGAHGNALEIKQYCSGGLTSWLLASSLVDRDGAVICTGADNWSFDDRFVTSRSDGGEPFSDVAHGAVLSAEDGFAEILGAGSASCPDQAGGWQTRKAFWEHPTVGDYRAAFVKAAGDRTAESDANSANMIKAAITAALRSARISPQYVTHFVPHTLGSGQLYRMMAKATDLPWSEPLYDYYLGQGYLGVSTAISGLVRTAEMGGLAPDSIALLLAVEYLLSATAVVLRVVRAPSFTADGMVRIAA